MKLTAVLLLLVAASVAVAGPQRSSRRFIPRRGQEAEPVAADEPVAAEEDPVEAEEPAQPRFRIGGKPSGSSSFTLKRSFSPSVFPDQDDAPVQAAAAEPAPAARTPVQTSPPRSRTRGSRTFIESIKKSNIPIEASQLEDLEKSKQSLQRISTRPSSRPSTRVSPSAAPAPRTPGRPLSVRAPLEQPSVAATNTAEPEAIASKLAPSARPGKLSGNDQESRRQRLLSLKKRPRAGTPNNTPTVEKKSFPEEEPAEPSTPDEATELKIMDKKMDSMPEKSSDTKLDEEVTETLDKSIKLDAAQDGETMKKKQMADKETVAEKVEEKMPEEAEPSPPSAVTPQPEASTTTAAPAGPRRINSLTRLRASRPVGGSGGTRPRTSPSTAAAPAAQESTGGDAQPRLSSRRGGRGNSRGGAALATSARISRPSSRGPASQASRTEAEEAALEQVDALSAGTTGSSRGIQRKVSPTSRRRDPVPFSIRRFAGDQNHEEGRGPRTVRHSLLPSEPLKEDTSAAPVGKQVGVGAKKTRRAGVRSLIERLRGRKTNRMRIETEQEARRQEAEQNITIKEEGKVINELAGRQPSVDVDGSDKIISIDSTTASKLATVNVAALESVQRAEKTPVRARAIQSRPRVLAPGLVKQREASKQPLKRRPRVQRRRRPIKFSTVALTSPVPQSSTSAEATTLPAPSSTTDEATALPAPSATIDETTTLPAPSATINEATTFPEPTASTDETTTLPAPSVTIDEATTLPAPSSTTDEGTTLPAPSAITDQATTLPAPSGTTVESTTLPPPASTTSETTTMPPQSTTTETTTFLPSTTTTEATILIPVTTTTEATTLPPTTTTTQTTTLPPPPPSTTAQVTRRLRRPLPSIDRTPRKQATATAGPPPTTTLSPPRTTTLSPAPTPGSTRAISWKPRVAPEDPVDAFNRGGFRFQPHPTSESDITRRRGEVVLTEVGTLEDTPPQQVAAILRGLGGRRRGLARPPQTRITTTTQSAINDELSETDYVYYDY